jgi:hypothetical protein
VDGLGQNGSDDAVTNGHVPLWTKEIYSNAEQAIDRRGIDALSGGTAEFPRFTPLTPGETSFAMPVFPPDDPGDTPLNGEETTSTFSVINTPFGGGRPSLPPSETPYGAAAYGLVNSSFAEDPYADELAQRSAEFARHAAFDPSYPDSGFDAPTPPQGLPQIGAPPPISWSPPPAPEAVEEPAEPESDTPIAAQLSLGQRFGMAFGDAFADPVPREPEPDLDPESPATGDELAAEADNAELPQRIPAEPDVPSDIAVPAVPPLEDKAQLSKIRDVLRRDDVPVTPADRPEGFDVEAILGAVRNVAGVREATMRTTPAGAHHLRLELAEGADPATISRMVARMLQEQMGLDAALTGSAPVPEPPAPLSPPRIPVQSETPNQDPPLVPGPRTGLGALPPSPPSPPERQERAEPETRREPRRRHPVSVPRRQPTELRPSERAAATWRTASDTEQPAGAVPPALPTDREQGPRAIIEHVQTSTFGLDATVEVRLNTGTRQASGVASGPAVDAYVLRLCAVATAAAIDDLLKDGTSTGEVGRCFVEHAALVPMGSCDVAVVVVLLVCGGWVEQLAGSALVSGDPRRAVVRATLSAVNRRLASLLP